MIIFGVCLIVGALADIFITAFSLNHLLLILFGILLVVINLAGSKINILKGVGRSLISLLVVLVALIMITVIFTGKAPVDNETADIISEAKKLEEDNGYEAAIKFLEDKNTDLGWNKLFTLRIAEIYMEQSMYSEGATAYGSIVRSLPEDLEVRYLYGRALHMNKDYNNVIKEAAYIAKINPEYTGAYVLMGDAYKGLNDHFREIYYYKIAVGLDETSVINRIRLAEAYGASQSYEKAIEHYEKAKEIASTFEEENIIYESYIRFADADSEN